MSEGRSAGRPKGSKNSSNILKLRNFLNKREIERFVELAKKKAEEDPQLLKFLLEQCFGKAPQTVDMNVAPQQRSFAELENNLKALNTKNDKFIEGEIIDKQGASTSTIQEGEWTRVDNDTNTGSDIQSDMAEEASSLPCDVPHEIREELYNSSGSINTDSDLSREMGNSGTIRKESQDNNGLSN
jgi:hypothetical protein